MTNNNTSTFIALGVALALSLFGTPAFAEIFKCTSTSGAVTYQQTPCQDAGDKVKIITPLPPPSVEDQMRAEDRLSQREAQQAEQQIQHQTTTGGGNGGNDVSTSADSSTRNDCIDAAAFYKDSPYRYNGALQLCNAGLTTEEMRTCLSDIPSGRYSQGYINTRLQSCILSKKN